MSESFFLHNDTKGYGKKPPFPSRPPDNRPKTIEEMDRELDEELEEGFDDYYEPEDDDEEEA